jgi:hypothetical protein
MDSKSRFYALEVMCRERARLADKESNYWLAEAEEWARFGQSCNQRDIPPVSSSGRIHSAGAQSLMARFAENEKEPPSAQDSSKS